MVSAPAGQETAPLPKEQPQRHESKVLITVGDPFESQVPLSKTDITTYVAKRFGHLGVEAQELVLQLALSPRRMRSFLTHLRLDPNRDLKGQLDVLFFYLVRQTDLRSFLMRARVEVSRDLREPTRSGLEAESKSNGSSATEAAPPRRFDTPLPPTRREIPVGRAQASLPQPLAETPVPKADTPVPDPVPSPAPKADLDIILNPDVPPPVPIPVPPDREVEPRAWIESPSYEGPCRRENRMDRRRGTDRRGKLDAVMSNRRYGGDRRKNPRGRRKEDLAKTF